ncbi:hypothetical protein [Pandoraea sp. ISTKB]|uniref:hypothetical protein n=1 Tax=Pandoraea sp. ISTKB TaxID=1586708 RepID=UPI000846BC7F|nr:hypothetical protein [Pandoraea sp. ISTKB]ODP35128.1 hypothetical protein A9762_12285 [Pandoraea sp. ISTKB]
MPDIKTMTFDANRYQLVPKKLDEVTAEAMKCARVRSKDEQEVWDITLAAAPTPAAQSAGQEAIYQVLDAPGKWFDVREQDWPHFADKERRIVYASPVNGSERAPEWCCFHCGETFDDRESAALHFGRTEMQSPACTIDIAEYRAMENRMTDYNNEDTELHREIARQECNHATALRREEEKGYARGLADAAKERAADAQQVDLDDETLSRLIGVIQMLEPIESGKAQTASDHLLAKTRERAATIADARRVLGFAIPMLRQVYATLNGYALTSPAKDGEPVCWWDSERNDMRWKPGLLNCDFADGQPFYTHPVTAKVGGDERDHIALAKSMLALVDEYHERPSSDTRKALRVALTDEFRKLLIRDAPSADGGETKEVAGLRAIAREYGELMRHMDSGGDFHEFHMRIAAAEDAVIAANQAKGDAS